MTERPIDLWRRMPEPTGQEPATELAAVLSVARRDLLALAAEGNTPAAPAEPRWTCFHCGDTFHDTEAATEHFGKSEHQRPACQIDVAEYRRMEEANRRHCEEDTDLHRLVARLEAEIGPKTMRAEEEGYAKGLADGRAAPAEKQEPLTDEAAQDFADWLQGFTSIPGRVITAYDARKVYERALKAEGANTPAEPVAWRWSESHSMAPEDRQWKLGTPPTAAHPSRIEVAVAASPTKDPSA